MTGSGPFVTDTGGQLYFTEKRTPWAVECFGCGLVHLTKRQYDAQMHMPDARWRCPKCGETAQWSDDEYDAWLDTLIDPSTCDGE